MVLNVFNVLDIAFVRQKTVRHPKAEIGDATENRHFSEVRFADIATAEPHHCFRQMAGGSMNFTIALIGFGLGCFLCGFSLGGRVDRWLCNYKEGRFRPRYGWPRPTVLPSAQVKIPMPAVKPTRGPRPRVEGGHQGEHLRDAPRQPPSGGSSVQAALTAAKRGET